MPLGGRLCLKGVKQFQIQSVTGSRACSADGVSKQGLTDGLWMVLEESIFYLGVYSEALSPGIQCWRLRTEQKLVNQQNLQN